MCDTFVKADSQNLPKVETVMILEYISTSSHHSVAEIRGAKILISSRDSYIESAVGYVKVARSGSECVVKAKVVPEHRIGKKLYAVTCNIDEHNNVIVDSVCEDCAASAGRTFGRPFKKMIQALIPLAFQMGAAATWAVVAAIVGVKTLAVTLIILKLLLVAGAAKIGALFASKGHVPEHHGWTPHQKEIHLHIHNSGHHDEEHSVPISPWSREGASQAETKHVNVILDPYANGPQTISTPYGHYMKIDPGAVTQ